MAQKTFVTGDVLTASDVNTYLMHEGGAFTSWTPVVVQSTTPTLTVTRAKYSRASRLITGDFAVSITSSATAANDITVTVPVAMATSSAYTAIGEAFIEDATGPAFYFGILVYASSTTCKILRRNEGGVASFLGSAGFTAALASGDKVSGYFHYESAS